MAPALLVVEDAANGGFNPTQLKKLNSRSRSPKTSSPPSHMNIEVRDAPTTVAWPAGLTNAPPAASQFDDAMGSMLAIAGETGRAQNTAAIVGGVVSGVLIIAIAVSLTVWLVLRRKRQERLRGETGATGNGIEDPRDREMQQQALSPGAHLNRGFGAGPNVYAQRPSRWNEAPPNQMHEAPFVAPIGSRHNASELS
ncbi:hypothetical protein CTRI78_v001718 [Colletotrichum trifolii]|uniref:Uncharacterized protein n=1 Tax=Colletotrichum trifolii TaxID=5466 RepID=A0A4R8RNX8_COLTR|nr:hypothetical protein CTRI78_v001718 [Colletotrichum trifolii]